MRHRVKNAPDLYRGTMVYPERERKVIRVKSIRLAVSSLSHIWLCGCGG